MAGNFFPMAEAKSPVLDWGMLRSDATYDVAQVWHGRFFRLDTHIARFQADINKLRLALPFDHDQLRAILAKYVRRAELDTAYVEMILTRGVCLTFSRDPRDAVNTFIAFAIPRIQPEPVHPTIKNYHWFDLIVGLHET